MHSQMEKQGEETMKKGSDCMHVSMDRREDVQLQETGGGRQKDKARKKSKMTAPKTARRNIDLFHF